jgi:hypothetical protein
MGKPVTLKACRFKEFASQAGMRNPIRHVQIFSPKIVGIKINKKSLN